MYFWWVVFILLFDYLNIFKSVRFSGINVSTLTFVQTSFPSFFPQNFSSYKIKTLPR